MVRRSPQRHDWARTLDVVLRHDHRAGEKIFVDYAGDKIPIHDRQTGEVIYQASLFVAVLGASNYTFAEATQSQELACWIGSHVHALEFLGGVPEAVIPDNVKTGVKHPCRYEPFWFSSHSIFSRRMYFDRPATTSASC
jgi:transposase